MKILLIGSGGREHAIADALSRENTTLELISAPGNPGLADLARLVPIKPTEIEAIRAFAREEAVDLVIVGPEAPLAEGLVDALQYDRVPVFGPTMGAAKVETSKADTKQLMMSAGIPTARAETHRDPVSAKSAVRLRFGTPVVIKASGLAAGKGVMVCMSLAEADAAIDRVLDEKAFGDAGSECLVESFMIGEELSLFALTDGVHVLPMLGAQDHKRLLEGDDGPNTGGMGAYAPVSLSSPALIDEVTERIFLPTLHALKRRGTPFTGLLYAGLMLTPDGPKVVEFNCRFGDPETQAILPLLESSLLDPMLAVSRGGSLNNMRPLAWQKAAAVTTVVAARGYPDTPEAGARIELPTFENDLRVYHAGTSRASDGALVTSGGRVLAITAIAPSFAEARHHSRAAAAQVYFEGAHHRRDIGWRESERLETARLAARALADERARATSGADAGTA